MKLKIITYFVLLALLGAIHIPAGHAQSLSMEEDLNIMKGILGKMLSQNQNGILAGNRIDAFYLDGFGVVFRLAYAANQDWVLTDALEKKLSQIQAQKQKINQDMQEIQKKHQELRDKMAQARYNANARAIRQNAADAVRLYQDEDHINVILDTLETIENGLSTEEAIEHIRSRLLVFFERYVTGMQNLKSGDRVSVLVEIQDWGQLNRQSQFLHGFVTAGDIAQFRSGKLSKDEFPKKVVFQQYNKESELSEDISMMSEILSRGFKQNQGYFASPANQGVYLNGYGALLFMNVPTQGNVFQINNNGLGEPSNPADYFLQNSDQMQSTNQEQMAQLRQKVLGLLGAYGYTLELGANEWVSLHVNTMPDYLMWGKGNTGFLIQLRQQDLNQYHAGTIDLKTLEKRARIQTY